MAFIIFGSMGCPMVIVMAEKLAIFAGLQVNCFLTFSIGYMDRLFFSDFFFGCQEIFGADFVDGSCCA